MRQLHRLLSLPLFLLAAVGEAAHPARRLPRPSSSFVPFLKRVLLISFFCAPTLHVPRSHAAARAEQVIIRGFGLGARGFLYAKAPAVLAWTTAMKLG